MKSHWEALTLHEVLQVHSSMEHHWSIKFIFSFRKGQIYQIWCFNNENWGFIIILVFQNFETIRLPFLEKQQETASNKEAYNILTHMVYGTILYRVVQF